jgi:hypothetical protein
MIMTLLGMMYGLFRTHGVVEPGLDSNREDP